MTQMETRRVILAATAINSPLVVFMRHLALPSLVDILPYSFPSFGLLFVLYLPRVDLDVPQRSSDLAS